MLKKTHRVVINNRGINEFGIIERVYRRKDIQYYNVLTERGISFEGLTESNSFPVYVDTSLSIKLLTNKLKPA